MNVNATGNDVEPLSVPETDAEMLREVYRQVVRMHSAVVERTNDGQGERDRRVLLRRAFAQLEANASALHVVINRLSPANNHERVDQRIHGARQTG